MISYWWLFPVSVLSASAGFILGAAWCALMTSNKKIDAAIDRTMKEEGR